MALDLGPAPAHRMGGTCSVGAWMAAHPDDADELRLALASPGWTSEGLSAAMAQAGHTLPAQAVTRHRRGACKCAERGLT